ncbi:hypothetical protein Patl1_32189 [Pistacia atlantica]|uniref:Uncharacterized protein n=1 Tax=Pistacia atlantica TaxID=434234 RepID=A0ACC1AN15_9ROSI|nr:hypothetical protein Patl1_32189 [Pistacia atlantica]
MAAKSFIPKTKTFTSPRPPVNFPTNPNLSFTSFFFNSISFFPHNLALIDSDSNSNQTLTFHELKLHVTNIAHSLFHLGIAKNDVILILALNSIHFLSVSSQLSPLAPLPPLAIHHTPLLNSTNKLTIVTLNL